MLPLSVAPSTSSLTRNPHFLINFHATSLSPSLPDSSYGNGIVTLSLRPVPGFVLVTVAFIRAPL